MIRVFIAVRHSLNPHYFYGNLWSSNFYPALRQLNCQVIESQIDLLPASRFMQIADNFTTPEQDVRDQITQSIINEVQTVHSKKPIDLFLSYFYNAHFNPSGFEEIHRLGIPTANFYCNSTHQFELVSKIASSVNYSWHTERDARNKYIQAGANPVWVQMGGNSDLYYPILSIQREAIACFVGQRYADRDRYLAYLMKSNIPVNIYGQGWGQTDLNHDLANSNQLKTSAYLGRSTYPPGSLSSYACVIKENFDRSGVLQGVKKTFKQFQYRNESQKLLPLLSKAAKGYSRNLVETFATHEVVLNFSNVWADSRPGSSLIPHVRLRDFEAPLCRTCYLTGYSDEIGEFYEIGKEIDTYRSPEELADKIQFYLSNPHAAEKLREAGYQRALRDHTWVNRFQELFAKIGLNS